MPAIRVLVCAVLLCAVPAAAQEPARFFDDNCSPCHAIGGPPGAAPDLENVSKRRAHAWLVQFIVDPERMAREDSTAAALVKQYGGAVMPATDGMTPELAEQLLRDIDGRAPAPSAAPAPRAPAAADAAAGRDWYEGRRRLSHGGPACVSCHRIESIARFGGGTLGPDLTQVQQRLGGSAGVAKWLGNPPTRVMRGVFRDRPLTDDEAFAIAALLAGERPDGGRSRQSALFVASGAAAALAMLGSMAAIWSRRLRSVRRRMVTAARKETP